MYDRRRLACDISLVLKLELPTFKGGKKANLDVHIHVFENWANIRGINKVDFVSYFHYTLKRVA